MFTAITAFRADYEDAFAASVDGSYARTNDACDDVLWEAFEDLGRRFVEARVEAQYRATPCVEPAVAHFVAQRELRELMETYRRVLVERCGVEAPSWDRAYMGGR